MQQQWRVEQAAEIDGFDARGHALGGFHEVFAEAEEVLDWGGGAGCCYCWGRHGFGFVLLWCVVVLIWLDMWWVWLSGFLDGGLLGGFGFGVV
jgi:hypothetical protein